MIEQRFFIPLRNYCGEWMPDTEHEQTDDIDGGEDE